MLKIRNLNTRYKIKDPNETTATMCVQAGKRALEDAGVLPGELDMVLLATDTPDFITPPTSARIQHEIGADNAGFFDINAACAGFTVALSTAWSFLKAHEELNTILVLGGYSMSKFSETTNTWSEFAFADGAGALVLKAVEDSPYGIQSMTIKGDGKFWDYFGIYAGGAWKGFSPEAIEEKHHHIRMVKQFPKDINVEKWPPVIRESIRKSGWQTGDIDKAFFTQSNYPVILKVCDVLGWEHSLSHNIMDRYGYTGSACIPMAMEDAKQKGELKEGEKILICTSGTGAAYGSVTLVWGKS
jgi:3-oxoacyl-[acyl-carrier-protein] synthase-3